MAFGMTRSSSGYKAVAGDGEAQGAVGGFADADARGSIDGVGNEAVVFHVEAGARVGDVDAVVGFAHDAESLAEAAWS